MKKIEISHFLLATFWTGWRRWLAWACCIGVLFFFGALRTATGAEFAFASLALIPVLVIAWFGGKTNGLLMALLAAVMWGLSDLASKQPLSADWIPWVNAFTRFATYSLVAVLAAQVRIQFIREHEHATRDPLTGLLNRRAFVDAGNSEVKRAFRYNHPLAIVFLDLDNFKQLNDTKGHDAGDTALKATSEALLGALRASDLVARLGGDEYAVLLPEIEYGEAIEAGQKLASAVNNELRVFPGLSGSIGVAWFEKADLTFSEMVKAADELMYEVKTRGKNALLPRRFDAHNSRD